MRTDSEFFASATAGKIPRAWQATARTNYEAFCERSDDF